MELTWPDPQQTDRKHADIRSVLLQEYSDRGQWARHYSAVRMTLGTFFITAAAGVVTLRWDRPQGAIAAAALGIFAIGVFLFMLFSHFTFREMNGQFDIVDEYRTKLGAAAIAKSKRPRWWKGTGLPIAILFTVAFVSFDWWWYRLSKPGCGQACQITVPMKVQVGQQPEVTIDVPVTVTIP